MSKHFNICSTLSSCVHAFASIIYPFSWQHTFIPLLPPNLIDVVCAPTPYIVGLLSSNSHLLNSLEDEMEEVITNTNLVKVMIRNDSIIHLIYQLMPP